MTQLTPFRINIPDDILTDLKNRLTQTRWTDEPDHSEWDYGVNPAYLRELIDYWQHIYDWRKHEAELNQFDQFIEVIDDVEIHFIYVKGKAVASKPLILTHGWPDSFYRFIKVIAMLTDPERFGGTLDDSFDVIIPSLPGFGFSDKVAVNTDQIAVLWNKLMKNVLQYEAYYAAGGDVGSVVTKSLANQYPDLVKAIHLTDVGYPNGSEDWSKMSPAEQEYGKFIQQWMQKEGAYNMIQSTKPQTLGYGLNDSPVGLAAWIVEKFYGWSDTKGNIQNSFSKDELLTNVTIYWVTQTINSSIRGYYEESKAAYSTGLKSQNKVNVPTGAALFPSDAQYPREWAQRMANIIQFNKMEKGGHFAALEVPELFVNELRKFFKQY